MMVMTHAEDTEEWIASRATMRDRWDEVASYIKNSDLKDRINKLLDEDPENPIRCILVLGVYSSYGMHLEDVDYVKRVWSEAMTIFQKRCPRQILFASEYWSNSVALFLGSKGLTLSPHDFGFDEA